MPEMLWFFNIINTYFIFEYMRRTFGYKYENPTFYLFLAAAFYFIHTIVNLQQITPLNITSDLILYNLISHRYFKARQEKVYFNAIFQFYLLSQDLIFTCGSAAVNDQKFTDWQKSPSFVSYIALNFIVYILTFEKFVKVFQRYFVFFDSKKNRRDLLCITIVQYSLTIWLSFLFEHAKAANIAGIILMLIIAVFITGMFIRFMYVQQKIENREQTKLFQEYAAEMRLIAENETNNRNFISDVCLNHISGARDLNEISQEEADAHVAHMKARLSGVMQQKYTNNTINAIMLLADDLAKEKGLKVKKKIADIDWNFIKEEDLVIILLGLVHNAVDASTKDIDFQVNTRFGHVLISMSHDCNMDKIEEGNEIIFPALNNLLKTRTGLIIETAKKYNANIDFMIEQERFMVDMLFTSRK